MAARPRKNCSQRRRPVHAGGNCASGLTPPQHAAALWRSIRVAIWSISCSGSSEPLTQKAVAPASSAGLAGRVAGGAVDEDGQVGGPRVGSDGAENPEAVEVRHHQVADHQVRRELPQVRQGPLAGRGAVGLEAGPADQPRQRLGGDFPVFNDQHRWHRTSLGVTSFSPSAVSAVPTGRSFLAPWDRDNGNNVGGAKTPCHVTTPTSPSTARPRRRSHYSSRCAGSSRTLRPPRNRRPSSSTKTLCAGADRRCCPPTSAAPPCW